MLYHGKYERARKYQKEQLEKRERLNRELYGEDYMPDISEQLEKGDMFALLVSGLLTILPIAILVLLIMVFIGFLFLRII